MTAPLGELADDGHKVARLVAYDDALAASSDTPLAPVSDADDIAVLHLLHRLRSQSIPDALMHDAPETSARYLLRGLQAEGGIGQVWLAYDTELNREVALKVLRPDRAIEPALETRFINEARVTGGLQHPGIVPVYDLSAETDALDQPPFYTMRLVQGRTLTEAIAEYHRAPRPSPVARTRLLTAFVSVCNTVAYAHARGVVHRDLKPANIALGDFGEVVVLDWGFAKVVGEPDATAGGPSTPADPRQTAAGQVLGTPAYMAPEQADGRADALSDVYGLGAILYELLTGQPPYAAADAAEVLGQLRAGPPPRPSSVARRVPPALEAICLRALARDPAERYASAAALANDVQHWLADEPVKAYREPLLARLRREARRHPAAVAASVALILTGLIAAVIGDSLVRREQTRSSEARLQAAIEHGRALANAQNIQLGQLYLHRIALAERTLSAYNPSRAIALLNECPDDLRNWEWHCLNRLCRAEQVPRRGHTGTVHAVAFSPDGQLLASAGFDRTIRLWEVTGRQARVLSGHTGVVYDLAFRPDGRRLASAAWDRTARIWDPATGQVLHTLGDHGGHVEFVGYSPKGDRLYTQANDGALRIWDAETGALLRAIKPPWKPWSLAVSPDGEHLAVGDALGVVRLLDARTGSVRRELLGHKNPVRAVAFSRDGRLLATGDGDIGRGDAGEIRVWEAGTGEALRSFRGHTDPVVRLAFHVSSIRLASASLDHTVKIWDLVSGSEALTLHSHTDSVRSVAFSADGRWLASAGNDRFVRIWDGSPWSGPAQSVERETLMGHADRALGVAFHPDGARLASVGGDWSIRVWRRGRTDALRVIDLRIQDRELLGHEPSDYFAIAYSADGKQLATASSSGEVTLLDADTGQLLIAMRGHADGPVRGVAFDPRGGELATSSWDRTVRIWDLARQRERCVLRGHTEPVNGVAYAPGGRWLASGSYDQTVRVWDLSTGRELREPLMHTGGVLGVAVSPDGRRLASAGNDGVIRIWDTESWREIAALMGHRSAVRAVCFSPDGNWLASAGHDWTVRLWRLADGENLAVFRGHTDRVHGLAFSPDGQSLASASYDQSIKLWNLGAFGN